MTRREWALKVFGLPWNASDAEVREAYRDLVGVWHPDKHMANERVRARAEAMMKRLNEARGILLGEDDGGGWVDGSDIPEDEAPAPEEETSPSHEDEWEDGEEPDWGGVSKRRRLPGLPQAAWVASVTVCAWLLWSAFGPKREVIWMWDGRFWDTNSPSPEGAQAPHPSGLTQVEHPTMYNLVARPDGKGFTFELVYKGRRERISFDNKEPPTESDLVEIAQESYRQALEVWPAGFEQNGQPVLSQQLPLSPEDIASAFAAVTLDEATVRWSPSARSQAIGLFGKGAEIYYLDTVEAEGRSWFRVVLPKGNSGYVDGRDVELIGD